MLLRWIESTLRNAYNLISQIAWQVQNCPKALGITAVALLGIFQP
jgi:hypothetical protein